MPGAKNEAEFSEKSAPSRRPIFVSNHLKGGIELLAKTHLSTTENRPQKSLLGHFLPCPTRRGQKSRFCPFFHFFWSENQCGFMAVKPCETYDEIKQVVKYWKSVYLARIAQNLIFRLVIGFLEEFCKEIELSSQKTKNGILPTRCFSLKTPSGLRFQTRGRG